MKRLALILTMMACALTAQATSITWTGAVSGDWSNPGNWNGGVVPVSGDALIFPAGSAHPVMTDDLPAGTSFESLTFDLTCVIDGNPFTVGNKGILVTTGTAGIINPVTVAGAQSWTVEGNLRFFTGPQLGTTPLAIDGHGPVELNGATGTTASITAGGSAMLKFTGGGTYTGPTTLTGNSQIFLNAQSLEGSLLAQNTSTVQVPAGSSLIKGNYSLDAGAMHVGVITSASLFSKLTVKGSVSLAGTLDLTSNFNAPLNTKYTILDKQSAGPVSGTFAGLPEGATMTLNGLTYQISYVGNDGNDVVLTVTAATTPTTTALTSSPDPSSYGQPVTLTATVAPAGATGTVTFKEGATTLGTDLLAAGKATFTTSAFSVGTHTNITATYAGSATFQGSTSAPLTISVLKSATTVALTSSQNPSSLGQSVTFTATVQPPAGFSGSTLPSGLVTFFDGPTQLGTGTVTNGVATFTTSALTIGSHTIGASYGGDSNFNSHSTSMTQLVDKAGPTVTIQSSVNPSNPGQSVTFTATVVNGSSPTGTVSFRDGGLTIAIVPLGPNGVATFTTSSLAAGTHSINARYSGDNNNYNATSEAIDQVVGAAALTPTTTTISSSMNPSTVGQPVTFTATVSPTGATGTVSFAEGQTVIGSAPLVNGQATFTTSTLSAGDHSITALYSGDATFANSNSQSLLQQVLAQPPPAAVPTLDPYALAALVVVMIAIAGWRLAR
ncbi:MAG: Ig-like domain repeat protein [Acidobacteria bacterium]|nr:Ig-like domain repeat protein [Acidobacteriota bacterium]